eukprot:1160388-Pelagomonas_calceolata.AAC.4
MPAVCILHYVSTVSAMLLLSALPTLSPILNQSSDAQRCTLPQITRVLRHDAPAKRARLLVSTCCVAHQSRLTANSSQLDSMNPDESHRQAGIIRRSNSNLSASPLPG